LKRVDEDNINNFVKNYLSKDYPDIDSDIAFSFVSKAFISGCFFSTNENDIYNWYENVFKEFCFVLDEEDYIQASIQALKIQFNIVGSDFGTSRQRDLGQKWSDTIRGYLGEIAIKKVLKKKWDIDINLGHEPGDLDDYLPSDIHSLKTKNDNNFRESKLRVSIKTTKANGMWFDIPGDQFNHSDIYLLALIGIETDHLFSFFKHISVFKDKILKKGLDHKVINENEANLIYDRVPTFKKIYGYLPGLITSNINNNQEYNYWGNMGRTNFKINNWFGKYENDFLQDIKVKENAKKVEFEGIGKFSTSNRYIFGLASLKNSIDDWTKNLINVI